MGDVLNRSLPDAWFENPMRRRRGGTDRQRLLAGFAQVGHGRCQSWVLIGWREWAAFKSGRVGGSQASAFRRGRDCASFAGFV